MTERPIEYAFLFPEREEHGSALFTEAISACASTPSILNDHSAPLYLLIELHNNFAAAHTLS